MSYLHRLFIAVDQFWNAVFGGDPDQTISYRLAKDRKNCSLCQFICRLLDFFDPGHCDDAIKHEEQ